jgi:hypothetical protein
MNRTTVAPRRRQLIEKPEVFRIPWHLSDVVYQSFNSLAHRAKLTPGTADFATRLCREEALARPDLLLLKGIMTGSEETAALSAEVLGGQEVLDWVSAALSGQVKPVR